MRSGFLCLIFLAYATVSNAQTGTLRVEVRSEGTVVPGADVVVNGQTVKTDTSGTVSITVGSGAVEITALKEGFVPVTTTVTVVAGQVQPAVVELPHQLEEHVTVSATRTGRGHDLRHSACTRMVEKGIPLPVIASLLGWSAGTTVRMAKRYGHISADAQRAAVSVPQSPPLEKESPDNPVTGNKRAIPQ
jgi:hypothetical protein